MLVVFLAGILWLPASLVAQETPPGVTIHVVQRGENLFRIALTYGLTVDELVALNGIADPSNIQVGQRLLVPSDSVPASAQPTSHVVQAGETLQSIANLYGKTVEELSTLNSIANPDAIYVGQVLALTAAEIAMTPTAVPIATRTNVASLSDSASFKHIVQQGETLFRIATNYGMNVNDLAAANSISDPTLIYAGQELIVPGVQPPQLALDLPAPIIGLDVSPLVWVSGQTGRVRILTSHSTTVRGTFLGQSLPSSVDDNGIVHTLLIGIPIGTEFNIYSLELIVTDTNGQSTDFRVNLQIVAKDYGSEDITLPPDKADLLNVNIENNELRILQQLTTPYNPERYFDGPMGLPAAAAMSSPFGELRSYNGGPFDRYHTGADFGGIPGTPIIAPSAGRVIMADWLNVRGNTTVIDHGWGVYTTYSHQEERYVHVGEFVTVGQIIGTIGSSGRATGPHLHWELWVNGIAVDPMQWVEQGGW
jgi:murein DD-endopeptidase MepM/ murein hydrolase activator NlpD